MEQLTSIHDVIEALGGATLVGELTGRSQPAVSNWKIRGKCAPEVYLVMTGALRDIGKSAPAALWGIEDPSYRDTEPASTK